MFPQNWSVSTLVRTKSIRRKRKMHRIDQCILWKLSIASLENFNFEQKPEVVQNGWRHVVNLKKFYWRKLLETLLLLLLLLLRLLLLLLLLLGLLVLLRLVLPLLARGRQGEGVTTRFRSWWRSRLLRDSRLRLRRFSASLTRCSSCFSFPKR